MSCKLSARKALWKTNLSKCILKRMRIIAGSLGGRNFDSPKGHRTHPMSERIRGALFNSLGNIENYEVLDAFAGTGALAFEALSRGASSALAIDSDKHAADIMKESTQKLAITQRCKVIRANVSSWSDNNPSALFDLVLADPPYDKVQIVTLQKLTTHVKPKHLFVLSWPGKTDIPEFEGMRHEDTKDYGDAQLVFYRRV